MRFWLVLIFFLSSRKIARLGEHDSRIDPEFSPELNAHSSVKDIAIEKIIIHTEYDPHTRLNDIALIRLAEEVSFDTRKYL